MAVDLITYLKSEPSKHHKLYNSYLGISKKEYPKWSGWKIITSYKDRGIDVNLIQDEILDVYVQNFYMLKYLKENNL